MKSVKNVWGTFEIDPETELPVTPLPGFFWKLEIDKHFPSLLYINLCEPRYNRKGERIKGEYVQEGTIERIERATPEKILEDACYVLVNYAKQAEGRRIATEARGRAGSYPPKKMRVED